MYEQAPRSVNQTLDELDFERGIWNAALNGELARVKKLLKTGTNPDAMDTSGYTALHYACRNNQEGVSRILLDHGADVNIPTRSGGAHPLHRAAYMGHVNIVALLLENGAQSTHRDNDGRTALHKAAERGHMETCRLLIKNNCSLAPLMDNDGRVAADLVPSNQPDLTRLITS